jgi:hypothetical protein
MSTSEDREWDAHWDRVEEDQEAHADSYGHKFGEYRDRDAAQEAADALNDDYDAGDDMEAEQQVRY